MISSPLATLLYSTLPLLTTSILSYSALIPRIRLSPILSSYLIYGFHFCSAELLSTSAVLRLSPLSYQLSPLSSIIRISCLLSTLPSPLISSPTRLSFLLYPIGLSYILRSFILFISPFSYRCTRCTVYTIHYILYTMYNVHYILYTLYIVHYTLYTLYTIYTVLHAWNHVVSRCLELTIITIWLRNNNNNNTTTTNNNSSRLVDAMTMS